MSFGNLIHNSLHAPRLKNLKSGTYKISLNRNIKDIWLIYYFNFNRKNEDIHLSKVNDYDKVKFSIRYVYRTRVTNYQFKVTMIWKSDL
jgi:hypothetical protein